MPGTFRFGEFELRTDERRLLRSGETVPIGARAFDLLHCLVDGNDRVVSKSELIDRVWPGTVVEENNLTVQVSALRKLLGADAVATVAGRGYKFAIPVRGAEGGHAAEARPTALDESPAVAVLPLQVLGEDARLQLLAEGLAEDLIALLARIPGLLTISRSSSFLFRHGKVPLAEAARQLGVRYLVEGSLRGAADTVKVSTRLVEAESGRVLWDGRFECTRAEAVDLQETIARRVLVELEPELDRAELAAIRRRRPENLDAWAHYRKGVAAIAQGGWGAEPMALARRETRLAFEIDEEFALARSLHALFTAIACTLGLAEHTPQLEEETLRLAEMAAAQDGGSPEVLGYAGCTLCDFGQRERGMEMLERALELDPSNVQAHVAYGASLCVLGHVERGLERLRHATRISPRDRRLAFWSWLAGGFLMRAGRVEEALAEARLAGRRDPQLYLARVLEAAALAWLERRDEAATALSRARELRPQLTLDEVAHAQGKRAAELLAGLWQR